VNFVEGRKKKSSGTSAIRGALGRPARKSLARGQAKARAALIDPRHERGAQGTCGGRSGTELVCPQARQTILFFCLKLVRSDPPAASLDSRSSIARGRNREGCSARKLLGQPARKDRGSRARWNQPLRFPRSLPRRLGDIAWGARSSIAGGQTASGLWRVGSCFSFFFSSTCSDRPGSNVQRWDSGKRAIEAAVFLQHEDFSVVSIGSRQSPISLFYSFRSDLSTMHNPI
jgi:hypothetical protein